MWTCPAGYIPGVELCYKAFVTSAVNMMDAQFACMGAGGVLATPTTILHVSAVPFGSVTAERFWTLLFTRPSP